MTTTEGVQEFDWQPQERLAICDVDPLPIGTLLVLPTFAQSAFLHYFRINFLVFPIDKKWILFLMKFYLYLVVFGESARHTDRLQYS